MAIYYARLYYQSSNCYLMVSIKRKIPIWAVLIIVLVSLAGSAAALTIVNVDNNLINPGSGTVQSSTDLTLSSQNLNYEGTDVTGTDVTVNNAAASDHTGNIQVVLKDSAGSLETVEVTGVTFTAGQDTMTTVTFTTKHSMDTVSSVDVVVEQTS